MGTLIIVKWRKLAVVGLDVSGFELVVPAPFNATDGLSGVRRFGALTASCGVGAGRCLRRMVAIRPLISAMIAGAA